MPRKPKAQPVELLATPLELLKQLGSPVRAEAINAATLALKKALIERALVCDESQSQLSPGTAKLASVSSQRNYKGAKTVPTEDVRSVSKCIATVTAASSASWFPGMSAGSRALTTRSSPCIRGMKAREAQGLPLEQYGADVSLGFISSVTDEAKFGCSCWWARDHARRQMRTRRRQ